MWDFGCLHFAQYILISPHGIDCKQTWFKKIYHMDRVSWLKPLNSVDLKNLYSFMHCIYIVMFTSKLTGYSPLFSSWSCIWMQSPQPTLKKMNVYHHMLNNGDEFDSFCSHCVCRRGGDNKNQTNSFILGNFDVLLTSKNVTRCLLISCITIIFSLLYMGACIIY